MYLKWIVALILSATVLMSCHSEKTKLNSIDDDKRIPTLVMDSLHVNYTESGLLRMTLKAPVMQRFMLADEPYSVFPKGIHIYFYTVTNELESEIVTDYAFNKEIPEEFWQAVGHVVITNYLKQQTLYTDTLYWNRAAKRIYTDAPVKIATPDSEIKGQYGMTSDERFENYEIRSVSDSHIYMDDEKHETGEEEPVTLAADRTEKTIAVPEKTRPATAPRKIRETNNLPTAVSKQAVSGKEKKSITTQKVKKDE